MTLNEYQDLAYATAIYPASAAITYPALGLASEAGEVCGKIKKMIRDGKHLDREDMVAELGDVLWYVAVLAEDLNISLDLIAEANINKLAMRKARGTLQGSGDHR
jgi:NTP pyrophosphatase (non-canonical NTP hydrolase)